MKWYVGKEVIKPMMVQAEFMVKQQAARQGCKLLSDAANPAEKRGFKYFQNGRGVWVPWGLFRNKYKPADNGIAYIQMMRGLARMVG